MVGRRRIPWLGDQESSPIRNGGCEEYKVARNGERRTPYRAPIHTGRRYTKSSEFPLIRNGGDGSVHPLPMRHKNNARNIEETSPPPQQSAQNDNPDLKITRNDGAKKKIKIWETPATAGQSTEIPPDTRKLWRILQIKKKAQDGITEII